MTISGFRAVVSVAASLAATAWLTVAADGRAPTARERFEAARTAEADVRAARGDRALRQGRRVLQRYEALVRRFPTSGYSDDALFNAGSLARWLYEQSGADADRRAAAKYFEWLIREYPASKHLRTARIAVRALAEPERRAAAAKAPTPAAPAPEPAPPPQPAASPRTSAAEAAPASGASAGPATLKSITHAVLDDTVRVTLALDREAPFTHEILTGPPRAFVDLAGTLPDDALGDATVSYDRDTVRQVRVGRRRNALRVVLDLADATRVSVFALYNPFRVVIDADRAAATTAPTASPPAPAAAPVDVPAESAVMLTGDVAATSAATTPVIAATATTGDDDPPAPAPAPAVRTPLPSSAPPALTSPAAAVPAAPAVPSANGHGGYSIARQLGLGISRIVIDPGHGGHDPGTLAHGTSEARLVLDVALRLEKLLERDGFDVVLTRRTDVFVPLEERTAIANRESADLFLSVHANASRDPKARGLETYYLSFASNPDAEAVAARENATSSGGMHNLTSIVRAIALNNKLDESRDLAGLVQRSLAARLGKGPNGSRSRGVKKAPFVVLIGAAMPSVLAEIGFITNRAEAALIKTSAYRQRVAESLQAAVLQYQRSLKRQTTVAATR
jgi:N-acetylmuramoyl-L-alanine amidase